MQIDRHHGVSYLHLCDDCLHLTLHSLRLTANHLDLAAIQWLSDLINEKKKMTFLTVTHDRAFLEDVCDSILELDRGSFYTYDGSYSKYLAGKEDRLANEDQAYREGKARMKKECECDSFVHCLKCALNCTTLSLCARNPFLHIPL